MLEKISSTTPAVMSGTGQEVGRQLYQTPEQKTVAMIFPDDEHGKAAERVIRRVMEFLPQLIRERQQATLNKLIDAFLVNVIPPKRLAKRSTRACRPRQRR